jgi:hypothetical protein
VWLQLPQAARSGEVTVLPSAVAEVSASTVNRKLAAVSAFYAHLWGSRTRPPVLTGASMRLARIR